MRQADGDIDERKEADMTEDQISCITFTAKDGTVYPVDEYTRPWKLRFGDEGIGFLIMTQNPADGVYDMRAMLDGSVEVDEDEYQKVVEYTRRNNVQFPDLQSRGRKGKGRKGSPPMPPIYKEINGRLVSSEAMDDFLVRLRAKAFDLGAGRWFKSQRDKFFGAGVKRQPPKF